jgi:tetratricopeptide (TPR) repeat protein
MTSTNMPYQEFPSCISLNNQAVELFQKGDYLQAINIFRRALYSLLEILPPDKGGGGGITQKPFRGAVDGNKMNFWSESPGSSSPTLLSQSVFVHQRVAFLCPASFCPDLHWLYSAFILYNLGISCQQGAIVSKGVHIYDKCTHQYDSIETADALNAKARGLYDLAFVALQKSKYSDCVLLIGLLNNTGHLLTQQCMMSEATSYFRAVCDLMNASDNTKVLFEKRDYYGLYLNSLISSYTASAA